MQTRWSGWAVTREALQAGEVLRLVSTAQSCKRLRDHIRDSGFTGNWRARPEVLCMQYSTEQASLAGIHAIRTGP